MIKKAFKYIRNQYVINQAQRTKLPDFETDRICRYHIIFSGRVQKVGFRLEISELAERLNERVSPDEMSLLEALVDHYFDSKKEDEPNIEVAYKEFCYSLLDVDPFQIDEIMSSAAALCLEHERAAFTAGIKTRVNFAESTF